MNRRTQRLLLVLAGGVFFAAGCAGYTQAKIDLTAQLRRGVESTRAASQVQAQVIDRLSAAQIDRLDAAFDADVTARSTLDADWVIAHRKAYIAARDALVAQRQSFGDECRTMDANLDAIDAGLSLLQQMHGIEFRLTFPEENR